MPTCVGFGTGRYGIITRNFSWKLASCASVLVRGRSLTCHILHPADAFHCQPAICFDHNPSVAHTSLLRHSFISIAGTGISACFPSTTPFGLALGPDLPRADEPSPGILGLSVCRILTYISLLTPAFSLPCSPPLLTVRLLRACNAPLPLNSEVESAASVVCLAPVHFRRRVTRLVSCYALFEGWLLLSQPPSCLCIPTSFST